MIERTKKYLEREQLLMHTDVYDLQGRYVATKFYSIQNCGLPFRTGHSKEVLSVADLVAGKQLVCQMNHWDVKLTEIEKIICYGERR